MPVRISSSRPFLLERASGGETDSLRRVVTNPHGGRTRGSSGEPPWRGDNRQGSGAEKVVLRCRTHPVSDAPASTSLTAIRCGRYTTDS